MKPEVILFQGTSHDPYWYNRAAGPYKLATHLEQNQGCPTQVIPNCTALTRAGYEQVFKKYGSENLVWIGFTTNWLAGRRGKNYYQQWWSADNMSIDIRLAGWYHTDVDSREDVYSCIYDQEMFYEILDMAKFYAPECQLVFGGSQLNRNEYFHPDELVKDAHYIKGNAESAVTAMHRRFRKGNFNCDGLPENDEYDYSTDGFKKSFIYYKETDAVSPNEWLPIEISRGCAFKCAFCNYDMKGTTGNYVNPHALRENLIQQYELYGTTKYTIMDDLYNDNYDKVQDLYDNCWSQLPFKPELAGYLRLDLLWKRPDQAQLLLKSGFRAGSFGIETLHEAAGKAVGKGLGPKRIMETLRMLREEWGNEVLIHAFFIAGLPHEPMDSLLRTVEWTRTTNLIHAVIWHYLELENVKILPPDTNVDKISVLGQDPEKYGYTFSGDQELKGSKIREKATKKIIEIVQAPNDQEKQWAIDDIINTQFDTAWANNVGVTLGECKYINKIGNATKLNTYFTLYADLRALGWTHEKIMATSMAAKHDRLADWEYLVKKPEALERLYKIIT